MKFPWQKKPGRAVRRGQKPDSARKVLAKRLGIGFLLVAFIALMLTGVWYGTRLQGVTISSVAVTGGETVSHAELVRDVETVLDGTYWQLIPKRFTLLVPKGEVADALYEHDRIESVQIESSATHLDITITEFVPHALWCEALDSTNCIFMDPSGYAFERAPSLSGSAFLRYVEAEAELQNKALHFPEAFLATTESFAALLASEKGFTVTHVEITGDDDVVYHLTSGARFITSPLEDPQTSFENLLTVLDAPEFTHLTGDNFEYIDLRFGNKVYVQELRPEIATSTASTTELVE